VGEGGGRRRGKYNKTIKVQIRGWRSRRLSKSERWVGGSRFFPTWKGGFEVQEELGREKERKQINVRERENNRRARDEIDWKQKGA
jgi:hypothetical protein